MSWNDGAGGVQWWIGHSGVGRGRIDIKGHVWLRGGPGYKGVFGRGRRDVGRERCMEPEAFGTVVSMHIHGGSESLSVRESIPYRPLRIWPRVRVRGGGTVYTMDGCIYVRGRWREARVGSTCGYTYDIRIASQHPCLSTDLFPFHCTLHHRYPTLAIRFTA